jgi:excisionase family DNA binding protein
MSASPKKSNPPQLEPTPRWMSVDDAAKYLQVSPQTIRSAMRRGDLRPSRLGPRGGPYRIDRFDVDRFLERRKRTLPPYRKGSHPWVAKRWRARRERNRARAR